MNSLLELKEQILHEIKLELQKQRKRSGYHIDYECMKLMKNKEKYYMELETEKNWIEKHD